MLVDLQVTFFCLCWLKLDRECSVKNVDVRMWFKIAIVLKEYSETLIYCSKMYHFPELIVQFLWFVYKLYLNYGP
jgi:hypothetical protein